MIKETSNNKQKEQTLALLITEEGYFEEDNGGVIN